MSVRMVTVVVNLSSLKAVLPWPSPACGHGYHGCGGPNGDRSCSTSMGSGGMCHHGYHFGMGDPVNIVVWFRRSHLRLVVYMVLTDMCHRHTCHRTITVVHDVGNATVSVPLPTCWRNGAALYSVHNPHYIMCQNDCLFV